MAQIEVATIEELVNLSQESGGLITIKLAPGVYPGTLEPRRSMHLIGPSDPNQLAILDGQAAGPVVLLSESGIELTLERLVITGGESSMGGGITVQADARITLLRCRLQANRAGYYGGGALYLAGGEAKAAGCVFAGNKAPQGGACLIDELGKASFQECSFEENVAGRGAAIRIREGGIVKCLNCRFSRNRGGIDLKEPHDISISGTMSRTPELHLAGCEIKGGLLNGPQYPGTLIAEQSVLPASVQQDPSFQDLGGNRFE